MPTTHGQPLSPWVWLVFLGVFALLMLWRPLGTSKALDGSDPSDDGNDCSSHGGDSCD